MATPRVTVKSKRGRKSKWTTHVEPNLDRIPKMKKQGLTDEQISSTLGIGYSTFRDYVNKYPSLKAVLKEGKISLIEDLEDTLYKKALGLCTVKKVKTVTVLDTRTGKMKVVREEKQEDTVAPDSGALIFALKNLASERWQDRRVVDNSISDMDQLKAIAETLNMIGSKGIDTSQFEEDEEVKDEEDTE